MSQHFQSMSRHKFQESALQGKKAMSQQRSFISQQSQQKTEGTLSRHRILLSQQRLRRITKRMSRHRNLCRDIMKR